MIQLHIEKLPEGVYLATSDGVKGLVAQGRTIQETIEIARDMARKPIEPGSGSLRPAKLRRTSTGAVNRRFGRLIRWVRQDADDKGP